MSNETAQIIPCFANGNPTGRNSYFRQHSRDVMFGGDSADYRAMLGRERTKVLLAERCNGDWLRDAINFDRDNRVETDARDAVL